MDHLLFIFTKELANNLAVFFIIKNKWARSPAVERSLCKREASGSKCQTQRRQTSTSLATKVPTGPFQNHNGEKMTLHNMPSKEWYEKMTKSEGDAEIGAGAPSTSTKPLSPLERRLVAVVAEAIVREADDWEEFHLDFKRLYEKVADYTRILKKCDEPRQRNLPALKGYGVWHITNPVQQEYERTILIDLTKGGLTQEVGIYSNEDAQKKPEDSANISHIKNTYRLYKTSEEGTQLLEQDRKTKQK